MTAVRMLHVNCDGTADVGTVATDRGRENACPGWVQFDDETAAQARRYLRRQGWTHTEDGRDLCPAHTKTED